MRDGRYQVTFVASGGVISESVWLFQNNRFFGISRVHTFLGEVIQNGAEHSANVHCRQHTVDPTAKLHLPPDFDLGCEGLENGHGFAFDIHLPGYDIGLRAIGKFLGDDPDETVGQSRRLS